MLWVDDQFRTSSTGCYVIEAILSTTDPQKSARIANAIATTYIDQEVAAKSELARRMSASLAARLDELRARVQKSEDRVEDYKSRRNIIGASGRLVSEQQLTEINNQLVQARARVAELNAVRGHPAHPAGPAGARRHRRGVAVARDRR